MVSAFGIFIAQTNYIKSVTVGSGPCTTRYSFRRVPRRFQASQPAGRKIVAQCVSTGSAMVPPQPRNGAEEPRRRSFFRPVPGLANAAGLLPTARRRGLLSVALRALRAVSFAACRYAGQVVN